MLIAAREGYTEVCKLLLTSGKANMKEKTPDSLTPLLVAVKNGRTEVCELLLANGSYLKERWPDTEFNALHIVAVDGNQSLLPAPCSHTKQMSIQGAEHYSHLYTWPLASQEKSE